MTNYYLRSEQGTRGPIPAHVVKSMAQNGELKPEDLVRAESERTWHPAKLIAGFKQYKSSEAADNRRSTTETAPPLGEASGSLFQRPWLPAIAIAVVTFTGLGIWIFSVSRTVEHAEARGNEAIATPAPKVNQVAIRDALEIRLAKAHARGDIDEEISILREMCDRFVYDGSFRERLRSACLEKATQVRESQGYTDEADLLVSMSREFPNDVMCMARLARAYLDSGNKPEARNALSVAQHLKTSDADALHLIAEATYELAFDSDTRLQAIKYWERAIASQPLHPESTRALMTIYAEMKQYRDIVRLLQTVEERYVPLQPNLKDAPDKETRLLLQILAGALHEAGEDPRAANVYRALARFEMFDESACVELGLKLLMTDSPAWAIEAVSPYDTISALRVRLRAYLALDDLDSLQQTVHKLQEKVPDDPDTFLALGIVLANHGERERALQICEQGLRKHPGNSKLAELRDRVASQ